MFLLSIYSLTELSHVVQVRAEGQKLLAQGIALGIMAVSNAPCKGKSFVNCLVLESFCPFRACGAHLRNLSLLHFA